jgi:hypothetical protein
VCANPCSTLPPLPLLPEVLVLSRAAKPKYLGAWLAGAIYVLAQRTNKKQLAAKVERSIKEVIASQKAAEFVQSNPDHVLEDKLPGLYLGKCEGDLSDSEQKNM